MVVQFGLSADMSSCEVGPGDSFSVNPFIYNDATKDMYVFIEIEIPLVWTSFFICLSLVMIGVLLRVMEGWLCMTVQLR